MDVGVMGEKSGGGQVAGDLPFENLLRPIRIHPDYPEAHPCAFFPRYEIRILKNPFSMLPVISECLSIKI